MKDLLILEMERAVELLKASETPFRYTNNGKDSAELKRLLLSIRQRSITIEKDPKYNFPDCVVIK